jgi:hypothetical protein
VTRPNTKSFPVAAAFADDLLAKKFGDGSLVGLDRLIYAKVKEVSSKGRRHERGEVRAEAFQQTQADIALALTKHEQISMNRFTQEWVIDRARINTNKAMRVDAWQFHEGDEAPVGLRLRVGGRPWNLESGDTISEAKDNADVAPEENENDGTGANDGAGGTATYRADWRTAHEEEDRLIAKIDGERAEKKAEQAGHIVESIYEFSVRILGQERADWFLDYRYNEHNQRAEERTAHTQAEVAKAYRIRKILQKAYFKEHSVHTDDPEQVKQPEMFTVQAVNSANLPVMTDALVEGRGVSMPLI